jgi:hypothetical protein
VNGFPQGPNGLIVPNGSLKMQLNVDGTIIANPGGFVAADIPCVFQFDKTGALIQPAKIWSNEELDPQNAVGLGTFYFVTFYDQNGAILNNTPLWWIFPEIINSTVDISQMVAISTVGGNVIYYPRSVGNSGTVTSVAFVGDGVVDSAAPSAPVTTSGNITATILTQSANTVLAGPTTGVAAAPTFRALVAADIPTTASIWNNLQNATADLTLANTTFNTTFNQTSAVNWIWANITAATNSVPQNSPIIKIEGTYWTGSVSATDIWAVQNVVASGTNPTSTLTFSHSGSTGAAVVVFPPAVALVGAGSVNPLLTLKGSSSGSASLSVASNAGSPNALLLPSATPVTGQVIFGTGGNPASMSWVTAATTKTQVDLTAQNAAITTTVLAASVTAGQFRLNWNAKVTTVDGASSTLGALTIVYTDPDSVVQTITCAAQLSGGTIATTATTNTTATVLLGVPLLLNCKTGTNITYAFAYASGTPGTMIYNLHIDLETFVG